MSSSVLLLLALTCSIASTFQHNFSNPMHGHSINDTASSWKEARQVHPYFDPQRKEKPLITTCCNLRVNSSFTEAELPPEPLRIQQKCYADVTKRFANANDQTARDESKNTAPLFFSLDRNMSICLFQCLSRELNASNKDGNIVLEKAINVTLVSARRKLGLTEQMVEKCVARANTVGPAASRDKGYLCNLATVEYEQCVLERLDLLCPEKNQIKAELCDKYRDRLRRKYVIK